MVLVFEDNEVRHNLYLLVWCFNIFFKLESEYKMNILDDDHEGNNQKAGHCHEQKDGIGASQEKILIKRI